MFTGDAGCLNPEDPQSKRIFTPDSCGPTLSSGTGEGMNIQPSVITFAQNSRDEVRIQGDGTISGALSAQQGMKQTTYVCETANINSNGLANTDEEMNIQPSVLCIADSNAKAAIDEDMCGTLKVCGGAPQVCL